MSGKSGRGAAAGVILAVQVAAAAASEARWMAAHLPPAQPLCDEPVGSATSAAPTPTEC